MKKTLFATLLALTALACSSEPTPGASEHPECDSDSCAPECDGGNCATCEAGNCPSCDGGDCPECSGAEDCAADQKCSSGQCIDLTPCELGCASNEHCNNDSQECVACLGHADCDSTAYCDTADGYRCKADSCAAGTSRCSADGIEICDPAGVGWAAPVPCTEGSFCQAQEDQAWCQTTQCTPGQRECAGARVVECAASGADWAFLEDCSSAGNQCLADAGDAKCAAPSCTPGVRECAGGDVIECDSLGLGFQQIQDCTDDNPCDPSTLRCRETICTPNESTCLGNSVAVCNGDGDDYAFLTPCNSDEICRDGSCEKVVCVPSSYTCQANKVLQCNASGTAQSLIADCGLQYCVSGESHCRPKFCTAGALNCDGDVATKCNAAGSAYETTTDCSVSNQVCLNGACIDPVCEPGTYDCDTAGNITRCNVNGSGHTTYRTCSAPAHCVPGYLTCVAPVCDAGQATCFGQVATTCNATGDGYDAGATDCFANDEICVGGACVPRVCEPNERVCVAGRPYVCDFRGTKLTSTGSCHDYSNYCDPQDGLCHPDVCAANSKRCDGTVLSTCAPDGSGWISPTDSATSGLTCTGGSCAPIVCTEPFKCQDGNLYECVDSGGKWQVTYCGVLEHCIETDFSCAPNLCPPAQPTCDGTRATTCSATGSDYDAGGTSCMACAGGACVTALFSARFDGGDTAGWIADGQLSASVHAGAAANGSTLGLELTGTGTFSITIPESQPATISWWQYIDSGSRGQIEFSSTSYPDIPLSVGTEGNIITFGSYAQTTLASNAWHLFEIRNINWSTHVCDIYVDGVIRDAAEFVPLSRIGKITLGAGSLMIDEIEFK